ncbi:MAG: M12 family metallo-peptidase [Bacteroidota bacterium]|nr:M12 family metallo-peptidase [Bacteroidota bacterium]
MKTIFRFLIFLTAVTMFIGLSLNINKTSGEDNYKKKKINPGKIKKVSEEISEKKAYSDFKSFELFNFNSNVSGTDDASDFTSAAALLNLKKEILNQILLKKQENILFSIPFSDKENLVLELTQSFPTAEDFSIVSKSGKNTERYINGLHYKGIIKGKENSIASVSIFRDFVMGVISDETGNYVLGSVKDQDDNYSDRYIFYNDMDIEVINKFKCRVDDYEKNLIRSMNAVQKKINDDQQDNPARLPVKIYFEADYQMYLDAASNQQNVANFISGFFNSIMTIYQNEGLPVVISQIGIWDEPDPYINIHDSYQILQRFGQLNQDNFQGNVAHLISTRNENLGGIAYIRVLCGQYNENDLSGRFSFSNIEPGYNIYPTYSWTVNVVAHEMGHSFGSRHTHACVWPIDGTIKAIDSCFTAEGGCFVNQRARIGTIMSYCHLRIQQGGGINLSFGFGQLPGDTIRLRYAEANCLDAALNSSEAPSAFDLAQNFPNPFNPTTRIVFALPVDANVNLKIYDITGKLVADLIQNKFYNTGFYDFNFNSSMYNLSSGIYFYKLDAGGFSEVKRMMMIK